MELGLDCRANSTQRIPQASLNKCKNR
jgi:DNA polymerase III delta prime subunit